MPAAHFLKPLLSLGLCLGLAGAASAAPLQSVPALDLQLYTGTWYEIAAYPTLFQAADCVGTTATYSFNPDGSIKVFNQCYRPRSGGGWQLERIEGRARVPDPARPSRLKVSFFPPFEGDYWVIALDSNYQHAVVGHPGRNFLWVLSRAPQMAPETYKALQAQIAAQGYDLSRLRRTPALAARQRY